MIEQPLAGQSNASVAQMRNALVESAEFSRVDWIEEIESTNSYALGLASQLELPTPWLIGTERQTAGRGRGRNQWWSADGALLFSLILDPARDFFHPDQPPLMSQHWPRMSLAAAVALCDVFEADHPGQAGLKWPNDVHFSGKKIAGILVEVPGVPTPRHIVLGMGVNLNNSLHGAPPDIRDHARSLIDVTGRSTDRAEFLVRWMKRFRIRLSQLGAEEEQLADAWRSYCVLSGEHLSLQAGERTIAGFCLGIDTDGALLIQTDRTIERCFGGVLVRTTQSTD